MTDRAALAEAIEWSKARLASSDRHFYSVESIARTQALIDAAQAHLDTLPKVKMVEVWHVEWVSSITNDPNVWVCADTVIAEGRKLRLKDCGAQCIRITGPHSHEVPSP